MNRNRKRRINNESELLEGNTEAVSGMAAPRGRVNFMEEVNYKMEEPSEIEEVNYVIVPNVERQAQAKEAFKKKRKGTMESF